MTTMASNKSLLDVNYYKNLLTGFTIPIDIRNDIIYCQKILRIYLKVYEMVLSREIPNSTMIATQSENNIKKNSLTRNYLNEIENEIYEINNEQKLLIKNLRSILDDYYNTKIIKKKCNNSNEINNKNNIKIDRDYCNAFISKQFIKLINNKNFKWEPINVKKRLNENELIRKYNLDDDKIYIELNDKRLPSIISLNVNQSHQHHHHHNQINFDSNKNVNSNNGSKNNLNKNNNNNNMKINNNQISLLKPKEERFGLQRNNLTDDILMTTTMNTAATALSANYQHQQQQQQQNKNNSKSDTTKRIFIPVSPAVNTSRLNLLQALNKAKTQKQTSNNPNTIGNVEVKQQQQQQQQKRKSVAAPTTSSSSSSPPLSSVTAEESPSTVAETRDAASPISSDDIKPKQPITADEYGQEMFLRLFNLYTHDYSNYLIEKRSKRKRRNVQSNEKSDYHYGHLEIFESAKKKKVVYLASPPANKRTTVSAATASGCNRKRKGDSDNTGKNSGKNRSSADRSNSSSPELKRVCNECMKVKKGDRTLSKCDACNGAFHVDCHSISFAKQPIELKQRICPPCQRDKLNFIAEFQAIPSDNGCDDADNNINDDDIVSLTNKQEKLQINNQHLLTEFNKFRNKYNDILKHKEKLLRRSYEMKSQLNYYFDIVKNIKKNSTKTTASTATGTSTAATTVITSN